MDFQKTIAKSATLTGLGLFSGVPVSVTFRPAPPNHGVVFVRTDLDRAPIPALVPYVLKRARRTTLRNGAASVDTTEHILSAIAGLGIDNVVIEINAPELPGFDGSAKVFVDALLDAGVSVSTEPKHLLVISEPIVVRHDDAVLAAVPSDEPGFHAIYDLDYSKVPAIGRQLHIYDSVKHDYVKEIAPSRTFCLEAEVEMLRSAGLGRHLTPMDVLVIGKDGPIGGNAYRFNNEPSRHKTLDLIGDLSLVGAAIQGKIIAYKSGHQLNQQMAKQLFKQFRAQRHQQLAISRNVLDIRKLSRILPHRYPMLLVDRVIEIDGDRRVLGVKNVTVNEPFFQGHYPGTPIMPGVLIVEAMAQLSGVLLGQRLENTGKLAILLSLDRVKLRKPVTPGDQLILEAEAVKFRSRLAHTRCRAYVGQDLAAEAEVKFMLVNSDLQ